MNGLEIIWRGCANTWECDEMGHMNVRYYLAKAQEGLDCFAALLGHGPNAMRRLGLKLAIADQHIRYQREVRAGTPLCAYGAVLAVSSDRLKIYVEIRKSVDQSISATIVSDLIAVDCQSHGQKPLPTALVQAAAARIIDLPAHGQAKGLVLHQPRPSASLAEAEQMGLTEIYRGSVQPGQIDRDDHIMPHHLMGMISDGIVNLIMLINPARGHSPIDGGGAALEYRFVFRKPARLGDVVCVRSGLIGADDKVQIFGHWILDLESGEAIATAEAVAVSFDLKTRKIIPISPELRAAIDAMAKPGLSA
jgi:acyl-CoA thioester hydrolase